MIRLLRRPQFVYLFLGILTVLGIYSFVQLPVSLFPVTSKVTIGITVPYQSYSPKQFFDTMGEELEYQMRSIQTDQFPVEKVTANFSKDHAYYEVSFGWGADPDLVRPAVENKVNLVLGRFDPLIRQFTIINLVTNNQGFFAVSFISRTRSLDDLYLLLNPLVKPISSNVRDASQAILFNPNQKEITVELQPEKMAFHQISVSQIYGVLKDALLSYNGGSLNVGDSSFGIDIAARATKPQDLESIKVGLNDQTPVFLRDIGHINEGVSRSATMRFKTANIESVILFASPKEGGNIKRMSDDISAYIQTMKKDLPPDVEMHILVNPSEFINNSIFSVIREVFIASSLAVLILFLFIGGLRNVFTAAIEIPLSLIIAFILMRIFGVNLNLVSLGGLALSAGMNVDASVVVLENIFRKLKNQHGLSYEEKLSHVADAVSEVRLPILTSTLISLLVFLPLIYTRGLTNALLGDLAKAVIFSHGISAGVALILVPTIRLHLLSRGEVLKIESPIESSLNWLENLYSRTLKSLLLNSRRQIQAGLVTVVLFVGLLFGAMKFLDREVIGQPESDWLIVVVNAPARIPKQIDSEMSRVEQQLKDQFSGEVVDTFSQQMDEGSGFLMLRMKSRHKIKSYIQKTEALLKDSPAVKYHVDSWSPSELQLPQMFDYKIQLVGGTQESRAKVAGSIEEKLHADKIYDTVLMSPEVDHQRSIQAQPLPTQAVQEIMPRLEISQFMRTATGGLYVERMSRSGVDTPIYLRFPRAMGENLNWLSAIPIGFDNRLISLGSIFSFKTSDHGYSLLHEDGIEKSIIKAELRGDRKSERQASLEKARAIATQAIKVSEDHSIVLSELDPRGELSDALTQLYKAFFISIGLILVVLYLQFGNMGLASIALVAIPFGVMGSTLSLLIFRSSLSLNSCLGVVLLNGIAVANSILMLDFIGRKVRTMESLVDGVVEASVVRLRPILITSLTTILGMLPIAFGFGEGGNTLQPLGISVSGGLLVSMLLTVYVVPVLAYRRQRRIQAVVVRNLEMGRSVPEVSL